MKRTAALALLFVGALWAGAQTPAGQVVFGSPAESDWRPPSNLPPGAEYHLVREDPVSHGIQALVRFPSGFSVPAHSHSCAETLVIMKGRLEVSAGATTRTLSSGDYVVLPAGTAHALTVKGWGKAVFMAVTDGPYDLKPVSP
ncbi:cupin domain-containing protein [bacterium]|nr:MAG: cupin domain-containing protein [bacterium]